MATMHKASMQNFRISTFYWKKKSMKYNKTSESLSEIQNTDSFNPRRKMKALQHFLC